MLESMGGMAVTQYLQLLLPLVEEEADTLMVLAQHRLVRLAARAAEVDPERQLERLEPVPRGRVIMVVLVAHRVHFMEVVAVALDKQETLVVMPMAAMVYRP